jgi:branched-subunit amino acid transport protein
MVFLCVILWCFTGFLMWLTRLVPIVEQELLTLPEHRSEFILFSGVCITQYFVFSVAFCRSLQGHAMNNVLFVIVCILVSSLLTIVLSVLRFTEPSWSWSYGSWIYNYLCSQGLANSGVARIMEKYRHKLLRRMVCGPLNVPSENRTEAHGL